MRETFTPSLDMFEKENEHKPTETSQDNKESERTTITTHEIKDKNGNILYQVHLELTDSKQQEVKSLTMEYEGKKVDLLGIVGLKNPVQIFIQTNRGLSGSYSYDKKMVIIPYPDTPVNIAVALHELGHAKQFENPFFKKNRGKEAPISWENDPREKLNELKEDFPELEESISALPEKTMDRLLEIRLATATIQSQIIPLNKRLTDLFKQKDEHLEDPNDPYDNLFIDVSKTHPKAHEKDWQDKEKQITEQITSTQKELSTMEIARDAYIKEFNATADPIQKLLNIPKKIRERDATRRAFKWMNSIQQETGAQMLTAAIDVNDIKKLVRSKESCVQSTARMMTIVEGQEDVLVKDSLLFALGTYNAFEKIPVPSLKRLEQMEQEENTPNAE